MADKTLHLRLKDKREAVCIRCGEPLLNADVSARADHTLFIPGKDQGIEIPCPGCKAVNAFVKAEIINRRVRCLKCDRVLGETYPGMPDEIDPVGKKTVFYKLNIVCPKADCAFDNEFYI